jgi:GT2 family glycosyltransferase
MGAFFMVRRSLFRQLGGFDERFFVYYEDLDFAFRAKKLGAASWFLADANVFHKGCGTTETARKERLFYYLRSRTLYGFKHFGRSTGFQLMVGTLLLEPVGRMALALRRPSGSALDDVLSAYRMLLADLPAILKTARGGRPGSGST